MQVCWIFISLFHSFIPLFLSIFILLFLFSPEDTIGDLKKLVAAQIGTRPDRIRIQKSNVIYKDPISLSDYEIKDGMGLEMYYN